MLPSPLWPSCHVPDFGKDQQVIRQSPGFYPTFPHEACPRPHQQGDRHHGKWASLRNRCSVNMAFSQRPSQLVMLLHVLYKPAVSTWETRGEAILQGEISIGGWGRGLWVGGRREPVRLPPRADCCFATATEEQIRFGGRFGVILGLVWDDYGGRFGIALGTIWGRVGIVWGLFWDSVGTFLGLCRACCCFLLFEGVCGNSRHPGPRRVWKVGSGAHLLPPLWENPLDLVDWLKNSKSRILYVFYQSKRTLTPPEPPPKRGIARGGPGGACGRVWRSFGRLGGSSGKLWRSSGVC